MSKSGEETSTPFIKLNDYTKREKERLLTFAAARQRGEIRQINLKASLFLSFFFFSVSTSQFRDVRLYIIFFPRLVFERKEKNSKEDLANSTKSLFISKQYYIILLPLGYFLNREIMEQKHRRKFRKFFEKNINFSLPLLNFIFPHILKQKSRVEMENILLRISE